ncbi:carnitine O-palmitoyltransferase 1 [Wickerhamomyces ciferrii]|uniref:Carnitine O-acetyltransferase, mitochondrial n=1 Tax=Wickerhamomyces ciferrii (strain ATCC 14091 / BCRC 22168 / CBS 111 / JCM 3599 / NBRC 0793 / NRRL Y-1031 F-60-10) TaxID=1206466 RepID=K0KKT5_WICCF|nr:carnitine O-palmitoyltransferase 1 [Wickerhamomyces ciferrii]CCH45805.1 carnitine O-palmitoyltransferase 1 [Wickerhamomyces ciferrii]
MLRLKPLTKLPSFKMPVKLYSTAIKGETFKHQDSLPPLPVPSIEKTKARYLQSIKPFVQSNEEYNKQVALVEDFFQNQGGKLHERLIEYSQGKSNWLSTFWDDYAYLQYNDPIVPYVSYFYGHRDLPVHLKDIGSNQIYKAIAIIDKTLDFVELIKNQTLPPEVIKGTPYCMNSFKVMFNNSRIPLKPGQDSNVFYDLFENGFITIVKNGHFFNLYTHDTQTNKRYPLSEIHKQLIKIIEISNNLNTPKENHQIGILTTLPRDQWYEAYTELRKSPINISSLDDIHKSSFLVSLDDDQPITYEDRAHYSWHGNGYNRYFDKPIQFFIAKNGYTGFIAEHSKMDGTPTLLLNEFVNREIWELQPKEFLSKLETTNLGDLEIKPKHLNFEISPLVQNHIKNGFINLQSEIDNHDVKVLHYNKFAKNEIKNFKTSPDAFIQVVLQLGIYKALGKLLPTYEAASTRRFSLGRTEATRSVSEEVKTLVENWSNPTVSNKQRSQDFQNAIKSHLDYIKAASAGEGIDRHFLGMKLLLNPDEKPHELYSDPLFNYSGTWLVSTSQLSSNYHDAYGWSEVNPIGWGFAYQINNDFLHVNICTRRSSGNKSEVMKYYIEEAFNEVYDVLSKEQSKAKL